MSAERFFDGLARTLAEPMPRRRAVRVIGASLAALAVPGISPRVARANVYPCATDSGRAQCPGVVSQGRYIVDPYCCKFPKQQWGCGDKDNGYKCRNGCPRWNPVIKRDQEPCWSSEKLPDGSPKHYNCCLVPDQRCDPSDINLCVECANICKPPRGRGECCAPGEQCCFNNTTTACCGPKQTCKAANVKKAKCVCKKGTKCGSDCCEKGETCCRGKQCCARGETCTPQGCCPNGRVCPGTGGITLCCDGQDEFCLLKKDPDDLAPLIGKPGDGICKKGCAPANRAGRQCCGTGYRPNRARTRCVAE